MSTDELYLNHFLIGLIRRRRIHKADILSHDHIVASLSLLIKVHSRIRWTVVGPLALSCLSVEGSQILSRQARHVRIV